MNQFLIGLLLVLVGAYIAYLLSKSYGRWKNKKKVISEFSESLKHTLPQIRQGVENAYLFNNDLNEYLSILKENELRLGYTLLPNKAKRQIRATNDTLSEFVCEFHRLSKHIYTFFENMRNRKGQGSENINTIVATRLSCMERDELPTEKTVINFPREMRGYFSQVICQSQQIIDIWTLGRQGNSKIFKEKRSAALKHLDKLDNMLSKFRRVW